MLNKIHKQQNLIKQLKEQVKEHNLVITEADKTK
jgi:hypothetical protein